MHIGAYTRVLGGWINLEQSVVDLGKSLGYETVRGMLNACADGLI